MDTRTFDTRTLRIRELNDALRATFPYSFCNGKIVFTAQVYNLMGRDRDLFWKEVMNGVYGYDSFTEDNDPHGEHDMTFFECHGESLFWKIDYYDLTLSRHSPDAADPSVTWRVLTVGFAEDY
jgi:Protein of unknown function (DUF3768)